MGLKEKVWKTLNDYFAPEEMAINDYYVITGFVVSPLFRKMDVSDRVDLIDAALATGHFTPRERKKISLIAPLSPAEYRAVGPGKSKKAKSKKAKRVEVAASTE